jgi:VanZ family protein
LFLGGRRNVPSVESPLPLDKAAHFFLYGLLGVLAALGWRRAREWPAWYWPMAIALLVGIADELHQRSVQGRSSEFADWVADAIGILVGTWIIKHAHKYKL